MTTIALITGANRGLGFEIARQLAQQGMTVILSARDDEKAQIAANMLRAEGLDVVGKHVDVSDEASVSAIAQEIEREYGRLDVLVNNAAAYVDWMEKPSNAHMSDVMRVLETNLLGAWRMTQAFLPLLSRSQHGRVVNIASGAGSHGDPQFGLATGAGAIASYGVSKAALLALTAKFAAEVENTGILINAVCPGLTATAPGMENMGARPVEQSVPGIVWAATLPDDGPNGGFFRDGQPMPW
jgi:NAD(P)-dependent dehydrogenase (short-subunit alcohol dehydrogenase family)